jgi:hypothetical protein
MRSIEIWKNRYQEGGNSGLGSQGNLLAHKVDFINEFIDSHDISEVLDYGFGDLEVAKRLKVYKYIGLDVIDPEKTSNSRQDWYAGNIELINIKFNEYKGKSSDLVLCLDVLYHILEDEQEYLKESIDNMVDKTNKCLIIYAQDSHDPRFETEYISHLYNSKWIQYLQEKHSNLSLIYKQEEPKSGCSAQFFVFEKNRT